MRSEGSAKSGRLGEGRRGDNLDWGEESTGLESCSVDQIREVSRYRAEDLASLEREGVTEVVSHDMLGKLSRYRAEDLASLEREGVTEVVSHDMLGKLKSPAMLVACCFTALAFVT